MDLSRIIRSRSDSSQAPICGKDGAIPGFLLPTLIHGRSSDGIIIWERKHVVCATHCHCGYSGAARSSQNLKFPRVAQKLFVRPESGMLHLILHHTSHHFKWGPAQRRKERRRKTSRYVAIVTEVASAKSNFRAEAEIKSRQG